VKCIFASRGAFRPVPLAAGGGGGAVWPGLRACESNFGFSRCFQTGLVAAGGSCMVGTPCKTPGVSSRSTGGRVFLVTQKTVICLVEKQDICSCPISGHVFSLWSRKTCLLDRQEGQSSCPPEDLCSCPTGCLLFQNRTFDLVQQEVEQSHVKEVRARRPRSSILSLRLLF